MKNTKKFKIDGIRQRERKDRQSEKEKRKKIDKEGV